ncbi:hypothetical protein [Paraburkholderia dinghuensis]|uniref:Uncharacterized protein n=1 Tax=Paraburkholderia dinghuensis TaxID=2305225 RepID=A0A3N6N448_9BURK|nr:hypothetical protein [Paraburkholderia dinghuensis]RQH03682.1 hypothetical protein D1Y85_20625 [Paraburkholderia dinghuensis]
MFARGLWLSIADNLPHYRVALDEPGRARDLRVPRVIGVMLMNHHLHPTMPWTTLPQLARDRGEAASQRPAYFRAALRQLCGLQPRNRMH